jgi:hypothetical protein
MYVNSKVVGLAPGYLEVDPRGEFVPYVGVKLKKLEIEVSFLNISTTLAAWHSCHRVCFKIRNS